MSLDSAFQHDMRFHVTGLGTLPEEKVQRVLDARLHGAFIHINEISKWSRRRGRTRAGILAIPPCLINRRPEFSKAIEQPNKKVTFPLGPYDLFIQVYRVKKPALQKMKDENLSLKKEVEKMKRTLADMRKQQQEKERLLDHILDNDRRPDEREKRIEEFWKDFRKDAKRIEAMCKKFKT